MKLLSSCIAVLLASSAALAAAPSDGERLAATCAGCHGTKGASPGSHIPVIGGQSEAYLKQVMKEYRDGKRPGGVMVNLAKGYSDGQIDEMSKVVASWKWENTSLGVKEKKKDKKSTVSVESCSACHGKKGEGTEVSPHIAGQAPGYLKDALQEYKSGRRISPDMEFLKDMSAKDVDAIIKYYTTTVK